MLNNLYNESLDYERTCAFLNKHGVMYGFTIESTDSNGSKSRWHVNGHLAPDTAREECLRLAREDGWTMPKWWQWWRWSDTRPLIEEPKREEKARGDDTLGQ